MTYNLNWIYVLNLTPSSTILSTQDVLIVYSSSLDRLQMYISMVLEIVKAKWLICDANNHVWYSIMLDNIIFSETEDILTWDWVNQVIDS